MTSYTKYKYIPIHHVSIKTCQLTFFCVSVKCEPISIKTGRRLLYLTKLCIKCSLHLKYVLALPWEVWSDILSCQCNTYMYILMNHWIATNPAGSYCLNCQTCSKLHHAQNVRLQCVPRSWMLTNWNDKSKLADMSNAIHRTLCWQVAPMSTCLRSCCRQTFRAYDVMMMWGLTILRHWLPVVCCF